MNLDKFYTIPPVSQKCIEKVNSIYDWEKWDLVIEPSAGNGSFMLNMPSLSKVIGIDIEPEHPLILKQDYLTYKPHIEGNILVIGNPPFGKVSSLAIKFFNQSAKWANVIAFIVPRTFRRVSVQNRLDDNFHLEYDEEIPCEPCAFTPRMMAKCCFQIWVKKSTKRILNMLETTHPDWTFLSLGPLDSKNQPTPPVGADFAIRAYGGKCGEIVTKNLQSLRPKSWHWIKSNIDVGDLIHNFLSIDFSVSKDTARQNSIGKGELVKLYKLI